MDVEAFALVPFWMRLLINLACLYFATGLVLSLYQAKRAAGSSVAAAIGAVLLAGLVTPYTAIRLLIDRLMKKTVPAPPAPAPPTV